MAQTRAGTSASEVVWCPGSCRTGGPRRRSGHIPRGYHPPGSCLDWPQLILGDPPAPKSSVPATAFADAWTQVDVTDDPQFFVHVLDATRTRLLERARRSPVEFFARFAPSPGLDVLDVGCGTGDMLRLLAPLVAPGRAVGIDVSSTMIDEARSRLPGGPSNVQFELGDVYGLDFEDEAFDRVIASQVLVHLP